MYLFTGNACLRWSTRIVVRSFLRLVCCRIVSGEVGTEGGGRGRPPE